MIEILVLFQLGRRIAQKAVARGRSGAGHVVLLVLFWFSGEIFGAFAGGIVAALCGMSTEEGTDRSSSLALVYVAALCGASLAAWTAFLIAGRGGSLAGEPAPAPISEFEA